MPLEDARKLADLKIENDDVINLCFLKDGTPPLLSPPCCPEPPLLPLLRPLTLFFCDADGTFEAPEITPFEPENQGQ